MDILIQQMHLWCNQIKVIAKTCGIVYFTNDIRSWGLNIPLLIQPCHQNIMLTCPCNKDLLQPAFIE